MGSAALVGRVGEVARGRLLLVRVFLLDGDVRGQVAQVERVHADVVLRTRVNMYVCVDASVCMCVCPCVCVCLYVCLLRAPLSRVFVCVFCCVCCLSVFVYVCMRVCACVCICE